MQNFATILFVAAILIAFLVFFCKAVKPKRRAENAPAPAPSSFTQGYAPVQQAHATPAPVKRSVKMGSARRVNTRWKHAARAHLSSSTYDTIIWDDYGMDLPPLFTGYEDGYVIGPDGQQYTSQGATYNDAPHADYGTPQGDSVGGADFSPQIVTSDFQSTPDPVYQQPDVQPTYQAPDNDPPAYQAPDVQSTYQAPEPSYSPPEPASSYDSSSSSDSGGGSDYSSSSSDSGSSSDSSSSSGGDY